MQNNSQIVKNAFSTERHYLSMALFMRKLIDSSSKVLLKSSAKCSGRQLLFSVSWVCQRKDQHTGQEGTAKSLIWRLTHLRDSLNVTPHTDAHSKVLTESETLYELQCMYSDLMISIMRYAGFGTHRLILEIK